jgi:receptor protein-tyrosine kinase
VEVTAVAPNANEAQLTANTYADAVVQYAEDNLNDPNDAQVTVADRAILPGQPARPRPTLYTVLAALIGLVVGAAAALLAGMLDRRVRSVEELNELTGVPILAHIALARGRRARRLNAEAYRVLRANMEFARPGMPLRAVAIVSPSEGEGKSSAVLNLARAVAEVGDRVIVVEGDLRRPAIQAALMAGTSGRLVPGLSNYLAGTASLEDVVYPTDMPRISLVPSGPTPPSPSALLESKPGGRLLAGLSDRADLVIVDTPPVSVGADASLLAAAADETLMVVDLHRSTKSAIRAAVTQLQLAQADIVGVLLNRVRGPGGTGGYDYGYYEFEDKRSTGRRRIPGLGRRQTSQLEDVPSPEVLPTPEIVPTDPAQPDEGAHFDEDEGHDDVRPGRVLADAGHEEPDQRSGDR